MAQKIPDRFFDLYGAAAGDREAFASSMAVRLPFSFRANTIKADVADVKKSLESQGFNIRPVPWYRDAFTADKPLGKTEEHLTGQIYIQELSSMLPPLLVAGELRAKSRVLDACAAPGSKTTQLAAIMGNHGLLVANDSSRGRMNALKANLQRCGVENATLSNYDLRHFPDEQFNAVILDAPCSGEGSFMENPDAVKLWSDKKIRNLSRLQKQLITKAFGLTAPSGVLVYSTCTFAPEENEMVVGYLLESSSAEVETMKIEGLKMSGGLVAWKNRQLNPELARCARVWPHINPGMGGFFMARIRKPE